MVEVLASLARHAAERPEAPAIVTPAGAMGYAELLGRVEALAGRLAELPETVGLLAPNGVAWVVADLALARAGRTEVPLPPFFAPAQLAHIIADAGVGHILSTPALEPLAREFGVPVSGIAEEGGGSAAPEAPALRKVVYTSGSSGRPKGVLLGERQLAWSAAALAQATGASRHDRYLSVLPFALLLEQICAIHLPLRVGAPVWLAADAAPAAAQGDAAPLLAALDWARPTATVLVPDLLALWVAALERQGRRAPAGLRLVAVGGASVPAPLAERAWALGIPVHEGYGLTECGSAVAVNRPGERAAGTVGPPLPGNTVHIEDGEIVVAGPGVMDGYLGGVAPDGVWRTGDLGAFDDQGRLVVHGRKDNLIVTGMGRNLSPEWVEDAIRADPRLALCVITAGGGDGLTAVLVPSPAGRPWFDSQTPQAVQHWLDGLVSGLPAYARPRQHLVVSEDALRRAGGLTANGRPVRAAIADFVTSGVADVVL